MRDSNSVDKRGHLHVDLEPGDIVNIEDDIEVRVKKKGGRKVSLEIVADKSKAISVDHSGQTR